jgi:hypothetical protein
MLLFRFKGGDADIYVFGVVIRWVLLLRVVPWWVEKVMKDRVISL